MSKTFLSDLGVKACHTGLIHTFTDPKTGIKFHGGGSMRGGSVEEGMLLINLASNRPPVQFHGLKVPRELAQVVNPVIDIEWPDFSVPPIRSWVWKEFLKVVRKEKRDVAIMCVGGHGRTGTALAIFAALCGLEIEDPVLFIREQYCSEAIESSSQIRYIEMVTGMKSKERARMKHLTGADLEGIFKK